MPVIYIRMTHSMQNTYKYVFIVAWLVFILLNRINTIEILRNYKTKMVHKYLCILTRHFVDLVFRDSHLLRRNQERIEL